MKQANVDISRHFIDRIGKCIEDSMDTMRRADATPDEAIGIVLHDLLYYVAMIAIHASATREDFLDFCGQCYDQSKKRRPK